MPESTCSPAIHECAALISEVATGDPSSAATETPG
jgi:hypothetical protein